MNVISIKQPWSYLECAGIKDIENRTWKLPKKYIGKRVLIHASASTELDKVALDKYLTAKQIQYITENIPDYCQQRWMHGAIIGSVIFTDCVINHPSIWAEKTEDYIVGMNPRLHEGITGRKPIYNWVCKDPILFDKPILNVKGKLSFWDYEPKPLPKQLFDYVSDEQGIL